jgi:hypothetical protein
MALETETDAEMLLLQPSAPSKILPLSDELDIKLIDFDKSKSQMQVGEGHVMMGAIVSILKDDSEISRDTIWSMINIRSMQGSPIWKTLNGTDVDIAFASFQLGDKDVSRSGALFIFKPKGSPIPQPTELLTLEMSLKPFMNLVWIGTFGIVIGFFVSAIRYKRKLNKANKKDNKQIHTNGNTPQTNGYNDNITQEEYSIIQEKHRQDS